MPGVSRADHLYESGLTIDSDHDDRWFLIPTLLFLGFSYINPLILTLFINPVLVSPPPSKVHPIPGFLASSSFTSHTDTDLSFSTNQANKQRYDTPKVTNLTSFSISSLSKERNHQYAKCIHPKSTTSLVIDQNIRIHCLSKSQPLYLNCLRKLLIFNLHQPESTHPQTVPV